MTKCYICERKPHKLSNLSFHKFPSDEALREKWLKVIVKDDPPPLKKSSSVCSIHFTEDCFRYGLVYGMRRITEDAVPSLYLQETEEETIMLNRLHTSSVSQTLDEVINDCHAENSEEALDADGNPSRIIYAYKRRKKFKNADSKGYKASKEPKIPKRIKLDLSWEKITSAPGGGKRYWEGAQKELLKRNIKIERLQLKLKQMRMKLQYVEKTIKELKDIQQPMVTIYVNEESSDMLVST